MDEATKKSLHEQMVRLRASHGVPLDGGFPRLHSSSKPRANGAKADPLAIKNLVLEELKAIQQKQPMPAEGWPDPHYECEECKDKHFTFEQKNGRDVARRCDCFFQRMAKQLIQNARIPKMFAHASLENYQAENVSAATVKLRVGSFIDTWPVVDPPGLVLCGPYGCGKTHLSVAILNSLILNRGARGIFRSYSDMLQQLQATFTTRYVEDEDRDVQVTAYDIISDVLECDVLVLDDIGKEKLTDWNLSMLYHLINQRYNHRRSTIVTTNLPWMLPMPARGQESLRERVGEAVHSRLEQMCCVVEIAGVRDFRRKRP